MRASLSSLALSLALSVVLASSAVGCSLPLSGVDARATNTCTSDAECGNHGACLTSPLGERSCVATEADLGPVILEVRPASDATGATVSHVFTDKLTVSGAFASGAIFKDINLQIPQKLTFSGTFLSPVVDTACTGDDGSLPVHVELRLVSPFANLSSTYKGDAVQVTDGNGGHLYRYSLDVPAGVYDVLLAPTALPTSCAASTVPPRLISAQELTSDTEFKPPAMMPSVLSGSIIVPDATDVSGWRLEVVDPDYGLVISDVARLSPPVSGISQILGGAEGTDPNGVRYSYKKSAVIRLRDTNGKLVVHWSLDLLDPTMVKLNLADLVANTQSIEANVVDANTQPVSASVRIQSVKLTGNANQNASFRVDVDTDLDGKIHADLVEGTYRVSISPKDPSGSSATLVEDWEVKGTLGFGHTFVLPTRPSLSGSVFSPSGARALADVPILASPVVSTQSYVTGVFNPSDALPRQSASQTDAAGQFQMLVDPGTLDVGIEPNASSGFSWLVVPRLLVGAATQKPQASLGTLTMPAPAFVTGIVSSQKGGAVPSAVVRAWLPVQDMSQTNAPVTPLIQIGETVSDEAGNFVLPLPPSISFTSPTP